VKIPAKAGNFLGEFVNGMLSHNAVQTAPVRRSRCAAFQEQ